MSFQRYWEGVTDAYIELITCGIREVALPNTGAHEGGEFNWDFLDAKARQAGVGVLTLRSPYYDRDANALNQIVIRKILYRKGAYKKALQLKKLLLLKPPKPAGYHDQVGKLLGYSDTAITAFKNKLRRIRRK